MRGKGLHFQWGWAEPAPFSVGSQPTYQVSPMCPELGWALGFRRNREISPRVSWCSLSCGRRQEGITATEGKTESGHGAAGTLALKEEVTSGWNHRMKRSQDGRDPREAHSGQSQQGQGHWAREKVGDEVQTEGGQGPRPWRALKAMIRTLFSNVPARWASLPGLSGH